MTAIDVSNETGENPTFDLRKVTVQGVDKI